MAKAFAPQVTVNCVAPGLIDLGEESESATAQKFAARTPMQRNGTAEDVAQAVLFFATGPRFITGQILAVDGGLGLASKFQASCPPANPKGPRIPLLRRRRGHLTWRDSQPPWHLPFAGSAQH